MTFDTNVKTKSVVIGLVFFLIFAFSLPAMSADVSKTGSASRTRLGEIEFKEVMVQDAVRVISEATGINIITTREAGETLVSIYVNKLNVDQIVDSICRISGLWYRYNTETGVYIIMTAREYQRDIVVFKYEPTRMFKLKYLNVKTAATTIEDLFGSRVNLEFMGRQFEDDYEIEGLDMGGDDSSSDDSNNNSSNNSSSNNTSSRNDQDLNQWALNSANILTPNQLARMGGRQGRQVQSVSADAVADVIQREESPIYLSVNRVHNMLFVRTADETAMEEIAKIVEQSDLQVPEVLLEMKVLAVELTDDFQSAFDISNITGSNQTGPDDGISINPLNPNATSVGRALLGMGTGSTIADSTMVFQLLSNDIRMKIQLLESEGNIKSLATPMLLAANNHPAKIFIGEETVLTTGFESQEVSSTGSGTTIVNTEPVAKTEVREIGNTLTILPSINADRSVVMRIIHENSSVKKGGGSIPLIVGGVLKNVEIDTVTTSKLSGTTIAMDGKTVAVGGMMRTSVLETEEKVPILGDVPLLGFFFKKQQKKKVKTELILLITPHVLTAPEQGEDVSKERLGKLGLSTGEEIFNNSHKDFSNTVKDVPTSDTDTPGKKTEQERITALTRVAVRQIRQPFAMRKASGDIRPVPITINTHVGIFNDPGVLATPKASWSDGRYYITALRLENQMTTLKEIDLSLLKGNWAAASVEADQLEPKGHKGHGTWLYLASSLDFAKNLLLEGTSH